MMRPIGWTLACCALLTATFPKTAITESVLVGGGGGDLATIDDQGRPGRDEPTKLSSVAKAPSLDRAVFELGRFLNNLFVGNDAQRTTSGQGRTFGVKRLQLMLMPMMYKMGVMMTLLIVLTVISLKGLLIGAILLMLKVSTIMAKFNTGWQHNGPQQQAQPIHVHVHNGMPSAHAQAYNAWMHSGPEDDDHYYYRG
ncbi:uncharacterized protein LOC108627585 [Ceratina calcarata]|uniref:Uncharacterized protein LOC108627585 n=1 Tax=Ceratina calcarata TaxID=156304 RepID=A0AAJ7J442_9HYME|nr:uncharacterized protein LOC108627585 [Ceratina calcarata]